MRAGGMDRDLDIFKTSDPGPIANLALGGKVAPGHGLQQPARDPHRGTGWRADENNWRNEFKPPPGMPAPGKRSRLLRGTAVEADLASKLGMG